MLPPHGVWVTEASWKRETKAKLHLFVAPACRKGIYGNASTGIAQK